MGKYNNLYRERAAIIIEVPYYRGFLQSPHFSTNVVNAVNFQVNFRNLHHSLQGLKLSCLQLIFEEDVNIDLDLI